MLGLTIADYLEIRFQLMPRITRYVLLQLILTFAMTLLGMTFVLVFSIMVKVGLRQGLGLEAFFRLLPYALPSALRFAVPASILMAACSVFGRMASENEVVAVKSLGISPRVMLYPALVMALLVSFGMIWLNDIAITWGASGMQTVIAESVEEVVFRRLKTEKSFRNKHFEINVKQVHGRKLIEPRLEVRGERPVIVYARQAELITDLAAESLKILLTDCTIERDGTIYANPGTHPQDIPLSKATIKDRSEPRVSELGLGHISNEAVAQQASIRKIEKLLTARAAFQMVMGDLDLLGPDAKHPDGKTWTQLHQDYRGAQARLNRLRLEPWRRCAEGFSCLFIVGVGAPLAIKMRTANFFTTFAMCFFPILCIYYPVLQWAVNQAKDGIVPPYTVWLGNGVLLMAGAWLSRKVLRY